MVGSARRGLPSERFGDGESVLEAITALLDRDGIGEWLALGSRKAAERIGHGSIDLAPQVKGLELPGYDPRALHAMALGLAVGTRGADHNRSGAYEADFSGRVDRRRGGDDSALAAIETEDRAALIDSLILAPQFLRGVFSDLFAESAELFRAVTGWDIDAAELRDTATRVVNARKCLNQRERAWSRRRGHACPARSSRTNPGFHRSHPGSPRSDDRRLLSGSRVGRSRVWCAVRGELRRELSELGRPQRVRSSVRAARPFPTLEGRGEGGEAPGLQNRRETKTITIGIGVTGVYTTCRSLIDRNCEPAGSPSCPLALPPKGLVAGAMGRPVSGSILANASRPGDAPSDPHVMADSKEQDERPHR